MSDEPVEGEVVEDAIEVGTEAHVASGAGAPTRLSSPALPTEDVEPHTLESVELVHQPEQSQGTLTLFNTADPVEVLERAGKVAAAFRDVLRQQGMVENISGKEHVKVEGWQTVGSMLAVYAVKEWVRVIPWPDPVPEALKAQQAQGKAFGFEASFWAQRPDRSIVGGGEASCTRSESMWRGRDDYALKAMAQTRATSRALRGPLGWIVKLAGYSPTSVEEMEPEAAPEPVPQGPPFGPKASEKLDATFNGAVNFLLEHRPLLVAQVRSKVEELSGGYLPSNAAQAVVVAVKAYKDAQQAPGPVAPSSEVQGGSTE